MSPIKPVRTFIKKLFQLLLIYMCLITVATIVISGINVVKVLYRNNISLKRYIVEDGIFIENADCNDTKEIILQTLDLLPSHVKTMILDNWTIVVSKQSPSRENYYFAFDGYVYEHERLIWFYPGATQQIVLYEFGNAVNYYLGRPGSTEKFTDLYNCYWKEYQAINYDTNRIQFTSMKSNFFAMLFSEMITNELYLKNEYPDIYNFYKALLNDEWNFHKISSFSNRCISIYFTIQDFFKSAVYPNVWYKNTLMATDWTKPKIELNQYQPIDSSEWLSETSKKMADDILSFLETPYFGNNQIVLNYDFRISDIEMAELRSFIHMHFGLEIDGPVYIFREEEKTQVYIYYRELRAAEKERLESLSQVENVLKTFHEGSDTELLIQVASYISTHSLYKLEDGSTFDSFWDNGRGDCLMYTMIFKQFADRLGIENDVVYVIPYRTTAHIYNRVLIDGEYRYYDLANGIVDCDTINSAGYYVNVWKYELRPSRYSQ